MVNFDRFCQHSGVTEAEDICDMAVFKSVIKKTLKDFSPYTVPLSRLSKTVPLGGIGVREI